MDKDKFESFVKENCEWRLKDYLAKFKPKDVESREESMAWKCRPQLINCQDCGEMVKGKVINLKVISYDKGKMKFEKRCGFCKKYLGRSK